MTTPFSGSSAVGGQNLPPDPYGGRPQSTPPGTQPGYGDPYAGSGTPEYADPGYPTQAGPVTDQGRPDVENRSVGQLVGELTQDLSTLMRQELELAKVEVKAEASKAGKGAGLLGGAGFGGYMVALFLSLALWGALWGPLNQGWAGVVVAVIWAIIAAVLYSMGRKELKKVNPKPERTVDTLQQVPGALKPH